VTKSPLMSAIVAAGLTLAIGLALNLLARRVGLMDRIAWLAAIVTPLAVGLIVYFMSAAR
jgi:hypothetical protein